MATLDQVLAILMGRKVYDATTKLWRVYDADGNELADPSGILLRGLHGWLLQQATMLATVPAPTTGGGWSPAPVMPQWRRPHEEDEALFFAVLN